MSVLPDAVDTRTHYVYRVFEGDHLLYIGCTAEPEHRIYLHTSLSAQSPTSWAIRRRMTHWTSERYPTKAEARAAERAAIAAESPELNRQHNPSRFTKRGGLTFQPTPTRPLRAR